MNVNRTARVSGKKEGAFQIVNGIIGAVAYFPSQMVNKKRKTIDTMRRAISYGVDHPTAGD